jgi:hypothetical protein
MSKLFAFGETVPGYEIPVLDEREARAAAGILFFFALLAFMNAWLLGEFRLTRIFVVAFLIDFAIRVFVNPRYAPSMILGRFAVRKQAPEWAGAPQKRFAWSVGLVLAVVMFHLIVIERVIGPINLFVCAACLTLMFFESAFGICLACKVYNLFTRQTARHCPGGVCAVEADPTHRPLGWAHAAIVAAFLGTVGYVGAAVFPPAEPAPVAAPATTADVANPDCTPPAWAVEIGHAEMWKLHHNCQ